MCSCARVEADADWSLFCPHECPGLGNCWGEEFETLYAKYESEGKVTLNTPTIHDYLRMYTARSSRRLG